MISDLAIYYDCPRCGRDWCKPINDDDPNGELRNFKLYGNEWLAETPSLTDKSDMILYHIINLKVVISSCSDCGHLFDVRPRSRLMTYKEWKRYKRKKRIFFWRKK